MYKALELLENAQRQLKMALNIMLAENADFKKDYELYTDGFNDEFQAIYTDLQEMILQKSYDLWKDQNHVE